MTRKGTRATYPTVYLSDDEIMKHGAFVRVVLRGRGVPEEDIADLAQETLFGAWHSMTVGRFRPNPDIPLETAVRVWLRRIALNNAGHELGRAWRRHEQRETARILALRAAVTIEYERTIDASRMLRSLQRLTPTLRSVLALAAMGFQLKEIARRLGIPVGTAAARVVYGRKVLARRNRRWRRW